MNKSRRITVIAVSLAATAAIGYAQLRTYASDGALKTIEGQTFLEVLGSLQQLYLDKSKVETDKLLQGAINGMLSSLEDPFTSYTPPEDNALDEEDLSGSFFGIGVTLEPANPDGTGSRAAQVYKNQPAAKAGMLAGDEIIKVNGEDITKLTTRQSVRKIRGPKDTDVKLTLRRDGQTLDITVRRAEVQLFAVETGMLPGDIGYISINTFYNERIFDQIAAAVKKMNDAGVKKLVLDMRDNGGGLLDGGIFVADQFLQEGNIVSLRDRNGVERLPSGPGRTSGKAQKQPTDYTGEMVVLVNKNSASASEIVAGALQDLGRAKVIGEKTFGKGVAQSVLSLPDGGKVAIVAQEWLTPKGRAIQGKGIEPDIVIPDSRRPNVVALEGSGAAPGTKITVNIGGKSVELTADKEGRFTYSDTPARLPTGSDVQGQASVDLKNDAQLQEALKQLGQR
ncbi:carboxyl-terminal processing protease [Deinobacterium chartae]|uniref:Carboxyl-terminal processing protease n=1 Tax=Deinobacterium chartae TaxID=521158 RepID=A0A841HUV5_9DEIO|nr:S41 family peptidase [Deinobacterium chartae]MBB6097251.1 carboxyl-terminal processing protease [Deinobacterium chartae]